MRYAIDRIRIGSEKEVQAEEFSGLYYIPCAHSRFFCPECGEQVYWRASGGSHSCHFYHRARTDTTPECDKRVDGRSELYIYERVGLPVYLTHSKTGAFQLNIAFPAIGEAALTTAAKNNSKATISCGNRSRDVLINHTNFFADATTLIPVRFIPSAEKNYAITYSNALGLQRKWSDYADGFAYGGGVFAYSESGGRKVRRGDSISPGQQYYVVTSSIDRSCSEIQYKQVGSLQLSDKCYTVYTMCIDVSVRDERRYQDVNQHVHRKYGVWLLETKPDIFPLWPPVIEQDTLIPTVATHSVICSVSSGNDAPNVYVYSGNSASALTVTTVNNIHSVSIPIYGQEAMVSVDRKYVGREITFSHKQPHRAPLSYQFKLQSTDLNLESPDIVTRAMLANEYEIESNARADLYTECADHTFLRIPIRTAHTLVPGRSNISRLLFLVENTPVHQLIAIAPVVPTQEQSFDIKCISDHARGVLIPLPRWVTALIVELNAAGYDKAANAIYRYVVNGRIPAGLVSMLEQVQSQMTTHTKG